MLNNIIDTHAHYDDEAFDEDRDAVLSSLPDKGVFAVINNAVDLKTAEQSIALAEKYPFVYAAVGIHPHECAETVEDDVLKIAELSKHKKVVAIGEIGLDYHYNFADRETSKKWFERQVALSLELGLPIFVHDRDAHADTMEILKKYKPSGVIHCFSGSVEMAKEVVKLGMYIGLGGAVTFKNAKTPVEVAKYVPLDRLLLETDAPYMTPVPFRGKRCSSDLISCTAEKIAEVRNMNAQEIINIAHGNSLGLFTKMGE